MKNTLASVALIVAIVFVGFATLASGNKVTQAIVDKVTQAYGAVSGPSVDGNYFSVGGVQHYFISSAYTATSSIYCILKGPSATSSIDRITLRTSSVGGIASTPATYVSTSSAASLGYATSTPSLLVANATTVEGVVVNRPVATTTAVTRLAGETSTGASLWILQPNERVVAKLATSSPGTFTSYMKGVCQLDATIL